MTNAECDGDIRSPTSDPYYPYRRGYLVVGGRYYEDIGYYLSHPTPPGYRLETIELRCDTGPLGIYARWVRLPASVPPAEAETALQRKEPPAAPSNR